MKSDTSASSAALLESLLPATENESQTGLTTLPDNRSPLERFRTAPRKAFSVTDIVSPAWCELQYWYTLQKGRKKRTPAMRAGSAVHKALEEQIHKPVQVDVQTKEDAWGLRIWNVIHGLRTLRETGQTRELEVWGTIDGLVVNGVIDDLSYICPDADLEATLKKKRRTRKKSPPPDQATMSDFFQTLDGSSLEQAARARKRTKSDKIYLCDVKTRGSRSLPNEAAFRPTQMQLMLYHRLISDLAANKVEFAILSSRYNLDSSRTFSDAFITQVGNLDESGEGIYYDAVEDTEDAPSPQSERNSVSLLLEHNNLAALWSLMISEFRITFPGGADSLGRVLQAEYRSRDSGEIVGNKAILMEEDILQAYIQDEMIWWRGEREAKGVAVEEAFKCRSCEFADTCEWRLHKIEEATEKSRLRRGRKTSVV